MDWRRQSLNRTDAKVPEGGVCTGTKGVAFVLAPRTLCTGAKGRLLDCHKKDGVYQRLCVLVENM